MKIQPFRDTDSFSFFGSLVESVEEEIKNLDNEYILKVPPTKLEEFYIDKVTVSPIKLYAEDHYIENRSSTQIHARRDFIAAMNPVDSWTVQGTRLDIAIPYEGDPNLWRVQPSTFSLTGYPDIEINEDHIVLSVEFPDNSADPSKIEGQLNTYIQALSFAIENLNRDVANHNDSAPKKIVSALQAKRKLAESVTKAISDLGIPIKRRDEPLVFTAPIKRRKSPVKRPGIPTEEYKPEPVLAEEEYEHILNVMRSMSLVIERNPTAFAGLDEEAIRTHFLLQLNGHYEGAATGETFNATGKTDILIRVEGRNVFIAECKFWRGAQSFNDAIDQLLSYLSWRDTKCALVVFNKNKDSTSVRQKMHEIMESHPQHRRTVHHDSKSDSRYVFVKESDPESEITITTQLYDIPTLKPAV